MQPSISVIIPTFNRALLVEEAVRSVLAQTFREFEIIVVDDGSTDGTKEQLARFGDLPNFRYCYQSNRGRSTARNVGIEMARGEFLLFLDSDDLLLPAALQRLYDVALCYPAAGLVAGRVEVIDAEGKIVRVAMSLLRSNNGKEEILTFAYPEMIRQKYSPMGSYLVRETCIENMGLFDFSLEPCEDYDFFLRMALVSPLVFSDTLVVQIRQHGSNTPNSKFPVSGINVAEKHLALINNLDGNVAHMRRFIRSEWMVAIADNYYILGKNLKAFKHYIQAVSIHPKRIYDFHLLRQALASLFPVSIRQSWKRISTFKMPFQRLPEPIVLSLLRLLYVRLKVRGLGRISMWSAKYLKGLQTLPVSTHDGRILYLDLREVSCIPYLLTGEIAYEKKDSDFVRAIVRPGDIAIDIGANVGWYSTLLAECVGQSGKVYAFEPNDGMFRLLTRTVSRYPQVKAVHAGLGNNEEERWLYVPKDSGQSSLQPIFPPKRSQKCRLYTLDRFLVQEGVSHITFVKCDVEGSELNVMLGAQLLLYGEKPPIWMTEVNADASSKFGYQPQQLFEIFHKVPKAGYKGYIISSQTCKLETLPSTVRSIFNAVFIPTWLQDRLASYVQTL